MPVVELNCAENKMLRSLTSEEIHVGHEKLLDMMSRDIVKALRGARTMEEEVEAISSVLKDPMYRLKMETLLSIGKVEMQQDLLKYSFSDTHRQEFIEAYKQDGKRVPRHMRKKI